MSVLIRIHVVLLPRTGPLLQFDVGHLTHEGAKSLLNLFDVHFKAKTEMY